MSLEAVFAAIDRWREEAPHAEALVQVGGRRVTFSGLGAEIDAVAAGLEAAGLRAGDNVLFSVRASVEAIVLILAIIRCGAVVVAIDLGMSPELFAARIATLQPGWVMAESWLYALSRRRALRSWLERRGVRLPHLDVPGASVVLTGRGWPGGRGNLMYAELAKHRGRPSPPIDPDAPAFIVFTSGTAADPRGVVHAVKSLGASLDLITRHLDLGRADRVYSDQLHMIVPALIAGASSVLPAPGGGARKTLTDLARFRPSHVYWVPAHAERILGEQRELPDSLRVVLLGSAPVTPAFLIRLRQRLPAAAKAYAAYAMTEMLPVAWAEMREKLAFDGPGDLVGAPCEGVVVRVAADGEILLAGPNLCARYLGGPPLDELASGDVGYVRDGRLVLLGRKKNMIIRGNHNIYPELMESAVAAVPGVLRSAMVGVFNQETSDEMVVLAVEPEQGIDEDELERRIRRQLWSGPSQIDVDARPDRIVVTQIPLAGRSDKVDREAVRTAVTRGVV